MIAGASNRLVKFSILMNSTFSISTSPMSLGIKHLNKYSKRAFPFKILWKSLFYLAHMKYWSNRQNEIKYRAKLIFHVTYRNRLTLHFLHDVSLGGVTVGNFILFEDGPVIRICEKWLVVSRAAFERLDRLLPHQMLDFLDLKLTKLISTHAFCWGAFDASRWLFASIF